MRIEVEQANLAGEAIGQLRLGLARSGDRLELTELRADLPGGSRGEIKGDFSVSGEALAFNGSLGLRGTSTARFVAWASGNGLSVAADADGPFELRAGLAVDAGHAEVSDLAGTLAGTLLKGSGALQVERPARAGRDAGRPQARRAQLAAGRHQPVRPVRRAHRRGLGEAGRGARAYPRQRRAARPAVRP